MKRISYTIAATPALLCLLLGSPDLQGQDLPDSPTHESGSGNDHKTFSEPRRAKNTTLETTVIDTFGNPPENVICKIEVDPAEGARGKWGGAVNIGITNLATLLKASYKVKVGKTRHDSANVQKSVSLPGHVAGDHYLAEFRGSLGGRLKIRGAHLICSVGWSEKPCKGSSTICVDGRWRVRAVGVPYGSEIPPDEVLTPEDVPSSRTGFLWDELQVMVRITEFRDAPSHRFGDLTVADFRHFKLESFQVEPDGSLRRSDFPFRVEITDMLTGKTYSDTTAARMRPSFVRIAVPR